MRVLVFPEIDGKVLAFEYVLKDGDWIKVNSDGSAEIFYANAFVVANTRLNYECPERLKKPLLED